MSMRWKGRASRRTTPRSSVALRPFRERDVERLLGWIDDESALFDWAGAELQHPLDRAQLTTYPTVGGPASHLLPYAALRSGVCLDAIGHAALAEIDPRRRSVRLGRVIVGDPALRGRGFGCAIVMRAAAVAFEKLDAHRVWSYVPTDNTAALRCFENAGFTREGVLRECAPRADHYVSCYTMSLLAREWERAQERGSAIAPPRLSDCDQRPPSPPVDLAYRAFPRVR